VRCCCCDCKPRHTRFALACGFSLVRL
jgi:hypothetical protein